MDNEWRKVLASHEEPQVLSGGPWLGPNFPGVALPSTQAIGRWIIIRCGDKFACAQVMDVGPWCEDDHAYVFGIATPRAEKLKGQPCPRILDVPDSRASIPDGNGNFKEVENSNGAGIDLFPYTAKCLGIKIGDNTEVEWKWALA